MSTDTDSDKASELDRDKKMKLVTTISLFGAVSLVAVLYFAGTLALDMPPEKALPIAMLIGGADYFLMRFALHKTMVKKA